MRISDWSSDVCSSDLLVRELPLRRVEIEPARLHDIACYAQFFRRGEQIAAALLMEPRVVWHGLDDVGGVRGQPGKLVDHHIRRGSCERSTYCLSVESIGDGRRSTDFTQQFDTRSATYHASTHVTKGATGAHQSKANRTARTTKKK